MEAQVLSRPVPLAVPVAEPIGMPPTVAVFTALAAAVLTGMLTSIGQGGTPLVATLAHATAPWFVIVALLVLVVRPRPVGAAVLGALCLELVHMGFWSATVLSGTAGGSSPFGLWEALDVPTGVLAGLVAVGMVARDGRLRAFAFGGVGALLVGEGVRSMLVATASTSVMAWTIETAVGVLAVVVAVLVGRSPVGRVVGLGTGVVGAAVVLGVMLLR